VLLGAWEWAQFCGFKEWGGRVGYTVVLAAAMYLAYLAAHTPRGLSHVLGVAIAWWVVAFLWVALAPQRVTPWLAAFAGVLVLAPACLALWQLSAERALLLLMLVLVFAADIGAYFAGRAFGRVKLAPRVSPGKTWEGAIGGVLFALLIAFIASRWLAIQPLPLLALSAATALISIVGDLTESMFKRHAGLKDSGGLLPGHGVTAAAPLFALGLMWFGALP
jgi:phosphatidate cytidylyltransferase